MGQIEKFQKKHGLVDEGIIGKNTLAKMREAWALNKTELAFFVGHCAHETGGFRYDSENLNYSEEALLDVFGKYFTKKEATVFAYNEIAIANRVYADRMGNGDEASGDGWRFRGRGAIQLTGKNNYERFAQKMGDMCILETPCLVAEKYFWEAGLYYFKWAGLWPYCQAITARNIRKTTKLINGGYNGLEDRAENIRYYFDLQKNKPTS